MPSFALRRVHTFEFEDVPWFPTSLRAAMTNVIVVACRFMGATDVVTRLVHRAVQAHPVDRIVDLGSGSGGMMRGTASRPCHACIRPRISAIVTGPGRSSAYPD